MEFRRFIFHYFKHTFICLPLFIYKQPFQDTVFQCQPAVYTNLRFFSVNDDIADGFCRRFIVRISCLHDYETSDNMKENDKNVLSFHRYLKNLRIYTWHIKILRVTQGNSYQFPPENEVFRCAFIFIFIKNFYFIWY